MIALERVRQLALALPEAVEVPHFGKPSYRVRGKIFAQLSLDDDRALLKLPLETQRAAMESEPQAYAPVPGYWGSKGSTYVDLSRARPTAFRAFLLIAWRAVAPKALTLD